MRIAICEDESVYRQIEKQQLEAFFEGEKVLIDSFEDGLFLLDKMQTGVRYDLILLDLQMEHSDGLDVAERIRKIDAKCDILFVTAMENRAAEGYRVQALDYILKTRLQEGLKEALERFSERRKEERLLLETADGEAAIVSTSEILWVESENRGAKLVTEEKVYHLTMPIGKVAEQLPRRDFIEIYKAVFVQACCIKRIGKDTVEMQNGGVLPLSRRKRNEVMKKVLEIVGGKL